LDTSDYPSIGYLARLNAQLLVQNQSVSAVVVAQLDEVERLFRAATQCDWDAILKLGDELVTIPTDRADEAIVGAAAKVCNALRSDPSGAKAMQHVADLLSACREAKLRRELSR
jgi:hypothetical protein